MQRQIFNSHSEQHGNFAGRLRALLAMTGLLVLSACGGTDNDVTQNYLPEPSGPDGVAPTLTTVTIQPDGFVESGQSIRIDFEASEALMTPVVTINGVEAEVTGKIGNWNAVREMTAADTVGEVSFSISYQDISLEAGQIVTTTTDGSAADYCADACPQTELGPLEGNWQLDFAGVGPAAGDTSWFSIADTGIDGPRACWFNDTYQFGGDGSFRNVQGDETYLEAWQGVTEGCGAPIAPHDGSNNAVFEYDEGAATLKLTGIGAFLGVAKAMSGVELTDPSQAPESVTYEVVELIGDSLTVRIDYGGGWWEYRLTRITNSPIVGNWKLDFAGVGPAAGDTSWFSIADTGPTGPRACWFDDVYHFADDGTFQNFQEGETYLEAWQGVTEGCGTTVAPHDGSTVGDWVYDEVGGTVALDGTGLYIGVAKAMNGVELTDPSQAPESVTYTVVELIGDSLTIRIDYGGGWWEYRLVRVPATPDLSGNWQLDFAGVGPAAGDTSWFSIADTGIDGPRACWFNDTYQFGGDGSFRNVQGDETYLEGWQGVSEGCGAPIAPHDGSNNAVFEYDEGAATLELTGIGAFLGVAKAMNGVELTDPSQATESVTYEVVELIGDSLTVRIDYGGGWWQYQLTRITNDPIVGNWKLGFAGVGPAAGDTSWFSIADTGPTGPRACWFDDVYHFADDGTFQNFQEGETYLETWQAVTEACGTTVAPHDGSTVGDWVNDESGGTLALDGTGLYIGVAKAMNGVELTDPSQAPESVTYEVVELIGDSLTIRIDYGGGWWQYELVRNE